MEIIDEVCYIWGVGDGNAGKNIYIYSNKFISYKIHIQNMTFLDFVGILYEDESMRCMCRVIIRTDELMKQGRKYIPSSVQSLLGSYRTPCFSR